MDFTSFLFFLFSFAAAQASSTVDTAGSYLNGQSIVAGILLILAGIAVTFFGFRLFKPCLAIAGFLLFTMIGYIILTRVEPSGGYANRDTVLLLGPLAIGLIGALLSLKLVRFGISVIGALGGAALALFILSWKSDGLISSEAGRIIFICLCAVIGSLVIHWFEKPVVIVSTSMLGSYLTFNGYS
jgi:Domain of unknown function (DUF4203)